MRLAAEKLDSTTPGEREAVLEELQERFDFPIVLARRDELPTWPQGRIAREADVVFYPEAEDRWFAATPLSNGIEVVRFGPFPSFERIEQKAATTTLALVLLPAALSEDISCLMVLPYW